MSYMVVLRIPAIAYMLVKAEIEKLPRSDYGHMIGKDRGKPEHIRFVEAVALEAMEPNVNGKDEGLREELATILEMIAKDGLDGPRDLDVALNAILSFFEEDKRKLQKISDLALTGSGMNVGIFSDDIIQIIK